MKFTAIAFLISASLVSAKPGPGGRHPPSNAMMMSCRDATTVDEFVTCFVNHSNSTCVNDTTIATLEECIDGLESAPTDVREFIMNSGCFDPIKNCLRENAPDRGDGFGPGIPPPIMEACAESETFEDFINCFVENADFACVDDNTASDIVVCVDALDAAREDIRDLVKNSGCFDTLLECMKTQMEEFISSLPECVPDTMAALGQCIRENHETCLDTCSSFSAPTLDIDPTNLLTCTGFQEEVIDPLCSTISCCEPCVEAFQDAATCLVNEYLPVPLGDCDFECPASRRSRELFLDFLKKWFGKGPGGNAGEGARFGGRISGNCLDILRLESENDAVTEEDLADLLECLAGQYLEMTVMEPPQMGGRPGLRGNAPPGMGDGN